MAGKREQEQGPYHRREQGVTPVTPTSRRQRPESPSPMGGLPTGSLALRAEVVHEPPETLDASRFVTDQRTLRVKGADNAFAVGDATSLPTSKSGVGAHLEAKVVARTLNGAPTVFEGRTNCPFDVAGGRATFVAGTYDAPVVPSPPSRMKHLMKMGFARLYWVSLRGVLDPVLDVYFRLTDPAKAARRAPDDAG